MNVAVYGSRQYDWEYLNLVNKKYGFNLDFFDFSLTRVTAINAAGCDAVCIFVNDDASKPVLEELASMVRNLDHVF